MGGVRLSRPTAVLLLVALLLLAGGCLTVGAALIYPPAGWITAGLLAFLAAGVVLLADVGERR